MAMSLKDAEAALRAAQTKAQALGIKVSVSVVDDRGDLVAFARMDGARHFTADVSRGKAMVSAWFGRASAEISKMAANPVFQSIGQMQGGRLVFGQGAVPVTRGGEALGAVGVSGGTSEQDEECAIAGRAAITPSA